ncbi:MAG: hypothetical protein LBL59_10415 [Xanthomonadaceae bacterium]|nr:hypothetical protein [Xanthomonadaceae bacterium]
MSITLPSPATEKEYWDRVIELTQATDGQYTAEQAIEALGLTDEDMEEGEDCIYRYFRHPLADSTTALEMLDVALEVWESSNISRVYAEEAISGFDPARTQALREAKYVLIDRKREVTYGDLAGYEIIYRLYLVLLAGLNKAKAKERRHG